MEYKVVITSDAEEDLDRFVRYLLFVKQNPQAATNVLNDFEKTKQSLSNIAGSLQPCENPHLNALGYRKMHFQTHRYFMHPVADARATNRPFISLPPHESFRTGC